MTSPPRISRSLSLLCVLLGSFALAACQSSPSQPPEPPPEPPPQTQPAPEATAAETQPAAATEESGASPGQGTPASPAQPEPVGTTADERIQALERELQASYQEHDAMLGEHQANTRAEAAAIAAQRGPETRVEEPDQGGLYEALPGFGPAPAPADTSEGAVTATETASGSEVGGQATSPSVATGGQPGGGRVPADIPDGRDDDIVARQLREAAQMETDPALREKLWDEYRKYKNQQATP